MYRYLSLPYLAAGQYLTHLDDMYLNRWDLPTLLSTLQPFRAWGTYQVPMYRDVHKLPPTS